MEFTRDFSKLCKLDVCIAGGKGASLGELTKAGIPVPEGFVILTGAFERFVEENRILPDIGAALDSVNHKDINTVEKAAEIIQGIILSSDFPELVRSEILSKYCELNSKFVAVRSSATSEDGVTAAWAGQLETFLNTTEENIIENIKKCWASLFSPRAIFYRFEKKLHREKISVAVVVQKMVQSEKSGIAFSVHPVTQDINQIIIEAGFGLGEAVVSGQITPDSYVIDKSELKIIDVVVNNKQKGLFKSSEGKTCWVKLGEKCQQQVLDDFEIVELSKFIKRIEDHYGFPVDVEWAKEQNKFSILQSRPITTLTQNKLLDQKKEYVFMWGTAPVLPSFWASADVKKNRKELLFPGKGLFQYFDGNMITAYMSKEEIEETRIKVSKKFLDPLFYKKYSETFEQEQKIWWDWIRKIEKKDYVHTSTKELIEDHLQFTRYQRDALGYFGSTRPEITFACEEKLKQLIKKHIGEDWTEPFGVLTTPLQLDDVQKEQLEFAKIAISDFSINDLKNHASKYPWLVFGQFDKDKVLEFLIDLIKNYAGESYNERLKTSEKEFLKLKKEQEELIKKFKEDKEDILYISKVLQDQAVRRMDIKSYWIGSYFLARNFWIKLSKELNLDVWDFLKYIFPNEIQDLLKKVYDKRIEEVIKERKKSYAINYEGHGDIEVLTSVDADALFNKKIKVKEEYETELNGQTASPGYYKGKARKVVPGDLETLKESIKYFNEGEILVTTMTQPNMMVIAKRAKAIVTDEGGITSHAAIISRELKIPCVVGCLYGMQAIQDGDELEVDANQATVRIIKKEKNVGETSDNYIRLFGITGMPFLLTDIALKYYEALEIIAIQKNNQWTTYIPKKVKQRTLKQGLELFTNKISFKKYVEEFDTYKKDAAVFFKKVVAKLKYDKNEVQKFFELVAELWKYYQKTEFFYVDSVFNYSKNDKVTKENLDRLAIIKDDGRKFLNSMIFGSNSYLTKVLNTLSNQFKIKHEDLLYYSKEEVLDLFKNIKTDTQLIKKRKQSYSYIMRNNEKIILVGVESEKYIKHFLIENKITDEIKGISANKGIVKGKVKIMKYGADTFDKVPKIIEEMDNRDILVADTTSPEIMAACKKASAILTNQGGLMSHAAIVSRELNIPCIVGLDYITEFVEDGDEVEVDADNGVVRIIKKA